MDENDKRKRIEVTNDEHVYDATVGDATDPTLELPDDSARSEDAISPDSLPGAATEAVTEPKSEREAENPPQTEAEPEAAATALVEQEPATIADRPIAFPAEDAAATPTPAVAAQTTGLPSTTTGSKKRLVFIAALIGLFIIIAALTWWLLAGKKESSPVADQTNRTTPAATPAPSKLGIAATVTDGLVEYMREQSEWQTMTTSTALAEGDSVRTGKDGRAVLTLDDGSAIRLDANTTIKLTSLTANQIQVEHLDGIAYSRVVPSTDRTYTVTASGATYQALGTAFTTINSETENGVRVFESSVKVNGSADAVSEGKQFFQATKDPKLQGLVSDIDIDTLVEDSFIDWNASLDEKDANFKDKLGILPQIKKRATEKKKQAEEAAAKRKAEKEAAAKKEAEDKAKAAQERADKEAARRADASDVVMTLSVRDGNLLKWNYTGEATNGYKVVYSKKHSLPAFGTDDSQYFKDNDQSSARLSTYKMKGKYYVRVCAYTKKNTCVDYSNVVAIDA